MKKLSKFIGILTSVVLAIVCGVSLITFGLNYDNNSSNTETNSQETEPTEYSSKSKIDGITTKSFSSITNKVTTPLARGVETVNNKHYLIGYVPSSEVDGQIVYEDYTYFFYKYVDRGFSNDYYTNLVKVKNNGQNNNFSVSYQDIYDAFEAIERSYYYAVFSINYDSTSQKFTITNNYANYGTSTTYNLSFNYTTDTPDGSSRVNETNWTAETNNIIGGYDDDHDMHFEIQYGGNNRHLQYMTDDNGTYVGFYNNFSNSTATVGGISYFKIYEAFDYDQMDFYNDIWDSSTSTAKVTPAVAKTKFQSLCALERYFIEKWDETFYISRAYDEATKVDNNSDTTRFKAKTPNLTVDYKYRQNSYSSYTEALTGMEFLEEYVIYKYTNETMPFYSQSLSYYLNLGSYYTQYGDAGLISSFVDDGELGLTIKTIYHGDIQHILSDNQSISLLKRATTSPTKINVDSVTATSITVSADVPSNFIMYGLDGGDTWTYDTNGTFSNLDPETTYNIVCSEASYVPGVSAMGYRVSGLSVEVTTLALKNTRTDTPDITIVEITDSSFRIIGESGVEYSLDGYSFDISGTITNLEEDTDYTVYARYAETDTYFAGPTVSRTVHTQKTIEVLRKKVLDQLEESYANHNGEGYTYVPGVYGSLRSQILAATTIDELNNLAAEIEPQMSFAASKDAGILAAKAKLKNSDSNFTEDDVNKEIAKIESLEYGKDNVNKIEAELTELEQLIEINRYKEEKLKAFCDYFNSLIKNDSNEEIGTLLVSFNTYYMNILSCTTKEAVDSAYSAAINGIK